MIIFTHRKKRRWKAADFHRLIRTGETAMYDYNSFKLHSVSVMCCCRMLNSRALNVAGASVCVDKRPDYNRC